MIVVTKEQQQKLDSGQAVEVTDSQTLRPYVILRKDVYERVGKLLFDNSDWTEDDLRLQLARSVEGNGWEEPGMEDYDRYDEERL